MKLIAKDLSAVGHRIVDKVDVTSDGDVTSQGVLEAIAHDLTSQGTRPTNLGFGLWNNTAVLKHYDGSSDYTVITSGTTLGGDLSGNLPSPSVVDDSHNHSNTTLSGVPGAGIDTTAVHSGDSAGGDISGTYASSLTVTALQGTAVYAAISPTEGQVLTWDNSNSRWDAADAGGGWGTSNFTVIDSSITTAQLRTALTTYDVIYAEPGTYSSVTDDLAGVIDLPLNTQFIALGGGAYPHSTTTAPRFDLTTTATFHFQMGKNSRIEGMYLEFNAGSAYQMINCPADGASVESCNIRGHTTGTAYYAISGAFKSIRHCRTYFCYGINMTTSMGQVGGTIEVSHHSHFGYAADTSSSNRGFNNTQNNVYCHHCSFDNGAYGIYNTGAECFFDNIRIEAVDDATTSYGIWSNDHYNTFSNIWVFGSNQGSSYGVYLDGNFCQYSNIYTYNTGNSGIVLAGASYARATGLYAYDCGDAQSADGIQIQATQFNGVFADISSRGSGDSGVLLTGSLYSAYSNISATENVNIGVEVTGTHTAVVISGVSTYNNTNEGVKTSNGTDCRISALAQNSDGAVNAIGSGWTEDATTVSSLTDTTITSPADGALLLYDTGTSMWRDAAMSGDASITDTGVVTVADDSHSHTSGTLTLALSDLTDTTISSPSQYQTAQWDGTDSWDNAWPAVVNETGNRNFVVLAAGTTAADINTALTNYAVVYLEIGAYAHSAGTTITVPRGKALIGLGTAISNSAAYCAYITISSTAPTSRYILAQNARVENLHIQIASALSTTGWVVVEGSSTYKESVGNDVHIGREVSTLGIYGFSGYFRSLRNWSTSYLDGLAITGSPTSAQGDSIFENFYVFNAPTYGINFTAVSDVVVRNGHIHGNSGTTDYGVYCTTPAADVENIYFENVTVEEPSITGFHFVGTSSFDISAEFSNCRVYGLTSSTDRGFYLSYADYSKLTNCHATLCNGTSGTPYGGLIFENSERIVVTGCETFSCSNTNNSGVYFGSTTARCTVSNHVSYQDYRGLWLSSSTYNIVDGFLAYDSGNYGVWCAGDYNTISNVRAYSCASYGFYATGDYCAYNNIYANNGANHGIVFSGANTGTATGLGAYSNGGYGINVSSCTYSTFSGMVLRDNTNHGLYTTASDYCEFGDIMSFSNSQDGVSFLNSDYCVLGDVNSYNNASEGVYVSACTKMKATGIAAWSNTGRGIYVLGNSSQSHWSDLTGYGNGTNDLDFSADPTGLCYQHGYSYGSEAAAHANWGNVDGRAI